MNVLLALPNLRNFVESMTIIRKKPYGLLRILYICHTIVVIIKVITIKNGNYIVVD